MYVCSNKRRMSSKMVNRPRAALRYLRVLFYGKIKSMGMGGPRVVMELEMYIKIRMYAIFFNIISNTVYVKTLSINIY